jgi:hypothetical protein
LRWLILARGRDYPGMVLDLSSIDLEEVGNALADPGAQAGLSWHGA